ncbi:MAG: Do family serine endopeptidase [Gammaproteobacteria bacterium]|nr:MAG: Do family serine endopeptidase [Gammaproteobacteria bacterium]UCH39630.1 MAG: Do family serine endopeptidase [Gammaproteobacteria bacterium]
MKSLLTGLLLLLFSATLAAALPSAVDGQPLPSLAPMLDRTTPAVVNIATRGKARRRVELPLPRDPLFRRFFDVPSIERVQETASLGSGVIVDADNGLILTNYHVIKDAYEIKVTLTDGRELQAEIIGRDPDTDVAVIQVPGENLVQVPIADSNKLRVGDFVVAIGNPFGLGQTVTSGIVSALGRSGLGIESIEDFIQTDASINLGNSGGALVNLRGELVGINTAIYGAGNQGSIGIGFAIPINMAHDIMRQLIDYGEVKRGRLGAQGQDLTPQLAQAFGIERSSGFIVTQIESGSPAYKAGLNVGDVIVAANGRPIRSTRDMHNLVGLQRLGQSIELSLYRKGSEIELPVLIQPIEINKMAGGVIHPQLAGATIGEMHEQHLQRGRVDYLEVLNVEPGSNAAESGFRGGDIIFSINKQLTRTFDEVFALVGNNGNGMIMNVQRGNRELYILLK